MKRKLWAKYIISLLFLMLTIFGLQAEEEKDKSVVSNDSTKVKLDSLFYVSDSTYYFADKKQLYLFGNAKIEYKNSSITADTIFMNIERKQAETYGKSMIKDNIQTVLGKSLKFDIDSKHGIIRNGISQFDKGFYYGEEIRKIDDKIYDLDKGYFTTCDGKVPHFYIYSHKMRIFQGDKIAAKPVIFYVNRFPVFAIPFATFSIKRGRHTGFLLPQPGYNSVDGKFIKDLTFYTYMDDYADARIALDFMQKTGWESRLESNYIKRYYYSGRFFGRLRKRIQQTDNYTYDWYFLYNHHHNFINNKTLDVNLNFVSSKQIWESSENVDKRLSEKITSNFSYKMPLGQRSIYFKANYTDDFKNEIKTITLPNISYRLPSKPIYEIFMDEAEIDSFDRWWKNFSYSYGVKALHSGTITSKNPSLTDILFQTEQDSTGSYINQHNAGIKHSGSISYSQKVLGWLNLSQSGYLNETWFDRDKQNNKLVRAMDYYTSSSAKFSLYGVRTFGKKNFVSFRHILTPNISFSYKPDFSDRNNKYYSFGGISTATNSKSRSLSFSLSNLWQTKWRNKKEEIKKINDLLSLSSSLSYNLEAEEDPFSDLSHSISVSSVKYQTGLFNLNYNISGNVSQDSENFDINQWSYSQSFSLNGKSFYYDYFPIEKNDILSADLFTSEKKAVNIETIADWEESKIKGKWDISFNHSFTKNQVDNEVSRHTFRTDLSFNLTKNWYVNYSNYYDVKDGEIRSQSLRITRELHCWKLQFNWSKSNDYWSYRINFFNIKLPESLKFDTRGHKQ